MDRPSDVAPAWDQLTYGAWQSQRSDPAREVHLHALEQVRGFLGEEWPELHHAAHGHVPDLLVVASWHPVAFQEVVELGARIEHLGRIPGFGKVRKETRGDVAPTRTAHTLLQLELADLGTAAGHTVTFEHGNASPADVTVGPITFEAAVVMTDITYRAQRAYSDAISSVLWQLRVAHGVDFDGRVEHQLDKDTTTEWLGQVEQAAAQSAATGQPVVSSVPGASVTAHPPGSGTGTYEGPPLLGAGWERTAGKLKHKEEQALRSGARWLRVDLCDGTFGYSPWYRQPLDRRTSTLAETLRETMLAGVFDGVVMSSGALCAFQGLDAATCEHPDGTSASAYWLGRARAREIYTVPLTRRGRDEAPLIDEMYALEPGRLDAHLARGGHPGLDILLG